MPPSAFLCGLGARPLRPVAAPLFEILVKSFGVAIMKRIINGYEVQWSSERVFAERQNAPNYGYLFDVSASRERIVRCAHVSTIGEKGDTDAGRFERDARQAVEEFLRQEREGNAGPRRSQTS